MGADPGDAHGPHREVGGAVVDLDAEGLGRLVPVPVPEGVHRFPRERFHIGAEDVRLGGRENELEGRRTDPGESVQFIQQIEGVLHQSVERIALERVFEHLAALADVAEPEQIETQQPQGRGRVRAPPERRPAPLGSLLVPAAPLGGGGKRQIEERIPRPVVQIAGLQLEKPGVFAGEQADRREGGERFGGIRQRVHGGGRALLRFLAAILLEQPLDLERPRRRKVRIDGESLGQRVRRRAALGQGGDLTILEAGSQEKAVGVPGIVPEHRGDALRRLGRIEFVEQEFRCQQRRQRIARIQHRRLIEDPQCVAEQCRALEAERGGGLPHRGEFACAEHGSGQGVVGGDHLVQTSEARLSFAASKLEQAEEGLRLEGTSVGR